MKLPLVSIIVTFYQAESYVEKQIETLRALSYPCLELIIIDNASKDKTCSLIENMLPLLREKFQRICFVSLSENNGPSAGFNAGIDKINGDYFVQTDGDDYIRADAISKMVTHAIENGSGAVQGFANYYENDTQILISQHHVVEQNSLNKTLTGVNTIFNPGTRLIRTRAFKAIYPDLKIYDSEQGQNWQVLIPFVLKRELDVLPVVVLDVSKRLNSHSTKKRTFNDVIERLTEFVTIWEHAIGAVEHDVAKYKNEISDAYAQHLFAAAYDYRQAKYLAKSMQHMKRPTLLHWLKYIKVMVGK